MRVGITVVVVVALGVGFAFGWAVRSPSWSIQLGDLAEWVAAIGTVAAFAATWIVISRDHKARRELQATAAYDAALAVTVVVEQLAFATTEAFPAMLVTVTNASSRSVFGVELTVSLASGETYGGPPTKLGELPPGGSEKTNISGPPDIVASVSFVDAGRVVWTRDSKGHIRRSAVPADNDH